LAPEQLTPLMERLQSLAEVFGQYLSLLEEKKKALLDGDYEELEAIVLEEEEVSVQITQAESKRDEVSRSLCTEMGLPANASVSEIAAQLQEKDGIDLMVHVARLAERLREVTMLHLNIREMIGFHLQQMDFLREIAIPQTTKPTYNPLQPDKAKPDSTSFKGKG